MNFNEKTLLRLRLSAYLVTVCIAAAIPLRSVIRFEMPENAPRQYLVPVSGYDPVDLFRGHYLRLDTTPVVPLNNITLETIEWDFWDKCGNFDHAVISRDEATGLAIFTPVTGKPDGGDYIPLRGVCQDWSQRNELLQAKQEDPEQKGWPGNKVKPYHPRVSLLLPETIQRFYLNEKLAPAAEEAINELQNQPGKVCLLLNVYDGGHFTVTDLYLDGRPFREYLAE